MREFNVRGYRGQDEAALLHLWNLALPLDQIDAPAFRRKVLLDANFDPDWLLVAESGGELTGFCLCLIRRAPAEGTELEPGKGWITAFGVAPENRLRGVGSALLERAMELFTAAGRTSVLIAPYVPNYFVPGVDVAAYAPGVSFLEKRGFGTLHESISMDANTVRLDYTPYAVREVALRERGVDVRLLTDADIPAFIAFLRDHMPGDWLRHGRQVLTDATRGMASLEQFVIAARGEEILGYCQHAAEHFGPFGVRDDAQGQGIGTVLLARCLQSMRRQGLHNAWVLWTSDDTARKVYSRFGFTETRRFALMRRQI